MADDEYTEAIGSGESEAAVEPGEPAQGVDDSPADSFDGSGPAEVIHRTRIPRTDATRKALADAVAKFATEREADDDDQGDFGEFDEKPTPKPAKVAAPAESAEAKPAVAIASQAQSAPPAPSLDPEVTRMRQQLAAEREEMTKAREALEKEREASSGIVDHEQYLESAPKAYRKWVESMRGTAMSDDEFRQEAADFVTLMSGEVLGVRLPDEVKSRIESQLTRKALSAYKANATRKEQAEANRRETERVQAEWDQAKRALDGQFKVEETAKEYAYLAAEDSPGSIVVDVIQSAIKRDGTKLSWQEASKQANDYLKKQASAYIDKRKHLLSAAPAEKSNGDALQGKQEARPGRPPGTTQVARAPAPEDESAPPIVKFKPNSTWDKEAHRRKTRAAFAQVFKPEE